MKDTWLKLGERMDDLLTSELQIIQSDEVFSFSMDAVLLANFCSVPLRGKVLDLCTGNGVVPLLLSKRTQANIIGVEIQQRLFDMAVRNVAVNGLEHQIEMVRADLRDYHLTAGYGEYDVITVNPPYLPIDSGMRNINEYVAAARHEIYCSLEDVISACSRLIRTGGKVAIVHRPSRLMDIITLMRQYRLEPKRMRFVHPRSTQEANMVLIEAVRDAKVELRMLPPLIVYADSQQYGAELLNIYYGHSGKRH